MEEEISRGELRDVKSDVKSKAKQIAKKGSRQMKSLMAILLFAGVMLIGVGSQVVSGNSVTQSDTADEEPALSFAETVRQSTAQFQEVAEAEAAGYGLLHGCVSSPQGGAMGVHYANGDVVGDGELDAESPEALIYEASYGQLRLVGVEYVVIAEQWDANNEAPPVLMGQLFNYVGSPNRYGLPAFYELHVWAWKHNPDGLFADWNPSVSCEEFTGEGMSHETH
jgi:hypothetical protein